MKLLACLILIWMPLCADDETREPISINVDDARISSPHHHRRHETLAVLRDEISDTWARDLSEASTRWFTISKLCDSTGQLCMFTAPILSSVGASINNRWLVVSSSIVGVGAVAIHRFGRYAANESQNRMAALNRILIREGVTPAVVVGDGSSNNSTGE